MLVWDICILGDTLVRALGRGQQGPAVHVPQDLCRQGEDFCQGFFFLHTSKVLPSPACTLAGIPRELHHRGTGTSHSQRHYSPHLCAPTNTVPTQMIATIRNRNTSSPNVALLHCKPPLSISRLPSVNMIPSPCHKLLGRKSTDRQLDEQSRRFALVAEI